MIIDDVDGLANMLHVELDSCNVLSEVFFACYCCRASTETSEDPNWFRKMLDALYAEGKGREKQKWVRKRRCFIFHGKITRIRNQLKWECPSQIEIAGKMFKCMLKLLL